MRKLLLILLVLLCGCSSAAAPKEETLPSSETEPYKTDDPETTPTPTPEPVEEPFVFPIEAVNTWGCSGSGISMEQNVEKKIIHLSDCHDAVLTKGSLYMLSDNTYTLSLNASSDADTTVTLSIEIEGEVLAAKDVSLNSEPQAVELSFNNNGAEIYDVFVNQNGEIDENGNMVWSRFQEEGHGQTAKEADTNNELNLKNEPLAQDGGQG